MEIKAIGHIKSDFSSKFGIPRQSGLVEELQAEIILEPEYRVREALRGLEEFSHLWLIWEFSQSVGVKWSPTVRPPRLGGNTRVGVFASRAPYRPNPLGLSCVGLEGIDYDRPEGPVIRVRGADLLDGTPIYDIKPYVPMADCHPQAVGSFSDRHREDSLKVELSPELEEKLPKDKVKALVGVLSGDPRPSYHDDPQRVYGMEFAGMEIKFTVDKGLLRVKEIEKL